MFTVTIRRTDATETLPPLTAEDARATLRTIAPTLASGETAAIFDATGKPVARGCDVHNTLAAFGRYLTREAKRAATPARRHTVRFARVRVSNPAPFMQPSTERTKEITARIQIGGKPRFGQIVGCVWLECATLARFYRTHVLVAGHIVPLSSVTILGTLSQSTRPKHLAA